MLQSTLEWENVLEFITVEILALTVTKFEIMFEHLEVIPLLW